jgi:hypothetical protein
MARKIFRKQDDDVRNITVREVTGKVGKVAATAVQIDKSIGLQEVVVFFQYAQTILTNPRVVLGTAVGKLGWTIVTNVANPGIILAGIYGATPLPAGIATLFELQFDLMPNVNAGDQGTIAVVESKVNPASVSIQGNDGCVTVG